jgi:hypothetical protein
VKQLQELQPGDVLKAYDGTPGCMCGCNGAYYVTPENREAAGRERGYEYDDEDVSAADVLRVLRLVQSAADRVESDCDGHYYVEANGRALCVYLTAEASR